MTPARSAPSTSAARMTPAPATCRGVTRMMLSFRWLAELTREASRALRWGARAGFLLALLRRRDLLHRALTRRLVGLPTQQPGAVPEAAGGHLVELNLDHQARA